MGATAIVGGFEDQLEKNVLLAFFMPAIVYMADAVGTQTETVLIRALSADVTVRSMLRRELITGLLMGLVIGGAFLVFALVGWGEADVAVAVALAMFASCSVATWWRWRSRRHSSGSAGIRPFERASGDRRPGPTLDRRLPGDRLRPGALIPGPRASRSPPC